MFEIVSAIIINRNRKDDLKECIESIRAQTHEEIEILVLDNASTDNPKNISIQLPYNMGVTLPTNIGVASAIGDYILLVDNDAVLDKEFVQKGLYIMNRHPKIGVIAGRVYKYGTTEDLDFESYGSNLQPSVAQITGTFCATACIIRRRAWESVKGYNNQYFAYYQEPDFAARIMKRGWDVYYTPECICWHKFTPVSRDSAAMIYFLTRNHYLFVWEHLPFWISVFQSIKWIGWSIIKGRHHPYTVLRAYLGLIGLLPLALRDRDPLKDRLFVRPWKKLFRRDQPILSG